ncbi:MAG: hypothetical protein VYA84_00770 [Planctomycetota bacterium]|nr:hypothetical protein [Planctomycetota bacterium]
MLPNKILSIRAGAKHQLKAKSDMLLCKVKIKFAVWNLENVLDFKRILAFFQANTMIRLHSVSDPIRQASQLRRWRCGRIVMQSGRLVEIQHRLFCGNVSVAQVWLQAKYRRSDDDLLWLDYHQPIGMHAFLTLDYIRSGTHAGYKTLRGACRVLDEIARIRNAQAIVAHVTNSQISDRLLHRLGWEQHLKQWKGRHWIRRFYNGYPTSKLSPYLTA